MCSCILFHLCTKFKKFEFWRSLSTTKYLSSPIMGLQIHVWNCGGNSLKISLRAICKSVCVLSKQAICSPKWKRKLALQKGPCQTWDLSATVVTGRRFFSVICIISKAKKSPSKVGSTFLYSLSLNSNSHFTVATWSSFSLFTFTVNVFLTMLQKRYFKINKT